MLLQLYICAYSWQAMYAAALVEVLMCSYCVYGFLQGMRHCARANLCAEHAVTCATSRPWLVGGVLVTLDDVRKL